MPSTSRNVEDERVGALFGYGEVAFGLFPLRYCLSSIDLSPYGETGKHNGDNREVR